MYRVCVHEEEYVEKERYQSCPDVQWFFRSRVIARFTGTGDQHSKRQLLEWVIQNVGPVVTVHISIEVVGEGVQTNFTHTGIMYVQLRDAELVDSVIKRGKCGDGRNLGALPGMFGREARQFDAVPSAYEFDVEKCVRKMTPHGKRIVTKARATREEATQILMAEGWSVFWDVAQDEWRTWKVEEGSQWLEEDPNSWM